MAAQTRAGKLPMAPKSMPPIALCETPVRISEKPKTISFYPGRQLAPWAGRPRRYDDQRRVAQIKMRHECQVIATDRKPRSVAAGIRRKMSPTLWTAEPGSQIA